MATVTSLERYVAGFLPGAARPLLQEMIRRQLDDFFTRTEVWKETVAGVNWPTSGVIELGESGQPSLSVSGAAVARFLQVRDADNGNALVFKTRAQMDRIDGLWQTRQGTEPALFTVGDEPSQLIVYPYASTADSDRFTVRAAVTIGTATSFPDFVFSRYFAAIRDGVVGSMLAIPGKDWTDLNLAGQFMRLYEDAVIKAKGAANADHGEPTREVRYGGI